LKRPKAKLSNLVSEANLKAKRASEKVESLKTQVKEYQEHKVVVMDGSEGQKMAMQADLDSFRDHMQSQVGRLSKKEVDPRLDGASKQQTDVMLQISEQIARAVAAESTAQSNRIEQMSGAVRDGSASGLYTTMAGCRITPVLIFWTGLPLHWVKFTF
jgi:hypothetical protein